MIVREYRRFFSEFLSHPKAVGTFSPSSSILARHLADSVDWESASTILEYGPGTGAITEEIVSRLPSQTHFYAIEISPKFADILRKRFPDVCVLEGSVGRAKTLCEKQGVRNVDTIVSGLPWAAFSAADQDMYLEATMEVLKPGGQFLTLGHLQGLVLPAARRFRKKLSTYFSEVRVSKPVWGNMPPAFFYSCRR